MNHSMALDPAPSREGGRHDPDLEMPFPIPRTSVAGMQLALILHQQVAGRKRGREGRVDPVDTLGAHGSTSLKGFTVTLA